MEHDLDDDFFPDDIDLDCLPADALDELEERAFLSTQGKLHVPDAGPNSSDYGLEDEDVVDLDAPQVYSASKYARHTANPTDDVAQREQWRLQRYANADDVDQPNDKWPDARPPVTSFTRRGAVEPPRSLQGYPPAPNAEHPQEEELDVSGLQARILELERERVNLQKAAEDAKSTALSKAGEIAIVRANQEKTVKEYERRMAAMQQSHSEEISRQRADLDAVRKDRETIETNNRFLEHDLAQEAERTRNMKKTLTVGHGNAGRGRMPAQPSPLATPRKDRHLPFRDGFDDDEVVMISPSKLRTTSRPTTPRAGLKRKRLSTTEQSQSPGQRLPLTEPEPLPHVDIAENSFANSAESEMQTSATAADKNLKVMQMILDHRPGPGRGRTVELMTHYSLPSMSSETLSSVIYDQMISISPSQDSEDFRHGFCNVLINVWSKCLEEKYYVPLDDVVELLQFVLTLSWSPISNSFIPRLVPLCLKTADVVALPTAKASKAKSLLDIPSNELKEQIDQIDYSNFSHQPANVAALPATKASRAESLFGAPSGELKEQIDPLDYLNFLHQIALDCYPRDESLIEFWTAMEFDFVLLMLHKAQPIAQMTEMLQLLSTSILPSSFGAISARTPSPQAKNESHLLDRLTVLLSETPESPPAAPPYSALETANLRTAVLSLLQSLAYTSYGGNLLAIHRLVIGRLVRFLHDAVLSLYAYRPATHAATTTHVNATVYLLSHLTSVHADVVDIRAKLAVVKGGAQKHLVCLSRVAFAEGESVLERGIEGEAAEAAHRMLDELLSPEEGEAVIDVFSSAR